MYILALVYDLHVGSGKMSIHAFDCKKSKNDLNILQSSLVEPGTYLLIKKHNGPFKYTLSTIVPHFVCSIEDLQDRGEKINILLSLL